MGCCESKIGSEPAPTVQELADEFRTIAGEKGWNILPSMWTALENRKGGGIFQATLTKKQFKSGKGLVVGAPTPRNITWWTVGPSGAPSVSGSETFLQVGGLLYSSLLVALMHV